MKKIIKDRYKGKTHDLILHAAETGSYIVCHSMQECTRIGLEATKMGVDIHFPMFYEEFLGKHYNRRGVKGVCIDNIEMFLEHLSMVHITAFTMNPNKEPVPKEFPVLFLLTDIKADNRPLGANGRVFSLKTQMYKRDKVKFHQRDVLVVSDRIADVSNLKLIVCDTPRKNIIDVRIMTEDPYVYLPRKYVGGMITWKKESNT